MAVASLTETRNRMTEILLEFADLRVHRYLPRQLNSGELPAFLLLPGEATHTEPSSDEEETARSWRLRLYIAPTAHGLEAEVEERAEAYIDEVRRFLNQRTHLEQNDQGLAGIRRAWVESDQGFREGRYPDTEEAPYYLFIEWRWRTVTRRNRR